MRQRQSRRQLEGAFKNTIRNARPGAEARSMSQTFAIGLLQKGVPLQEIYNLQEFQAFYLENPEDGQTWIRELRQQARQINVTGDWDNAQVPAVAFSQTQPQPSHRSWARTALGILSILVGLVGAAAFWATGSIDSLTTGGLTILMLIYSVLLGIMLMRK